MTNTIQRSALNVPFAIERPDRVPSRRYFDDEFFAMENELLWPRVWQMACRLEDIQKPGDFMEYEILDRSVVVVRVDATTIKAYENTCRHRGVKLACGSGSIPSGFTCPFHGWCWDLNGNNTFIYLPELFSASQQDSEDLRLIEVRCDTALGCVFINFDRDAPPLRDSIEPFASQMDLWRVEDLRAEWWMACELPTNWKLAMEAFMESYHAMQTHPQLIPPGSRQRAGANADRRGTGDARVRGSRSGQNSSTSASRAYIDVEVEYLRKVSLGMGGMTHRNDVRIAEGLRDLDLGADAGNFGKAWIHALNDAVTAWHTARGSKMPDLNYLTDNNLATLVNFCFPHYFLLPRMSSAASYRIRPLTAETCLFEIWSLTRYPAGLEPEPPKKPIPLPPNSAEWPPIPAQDFANLPIQQKAVHNPGFHYMRLSEKVEGMISNYQRLIDGYLAGLGYDDLVPAVQRVSRPMDDEIRDIGF